MSGPNRSCYRTDWGAPEGGEATYTVRGCADHRLQLKNAPYDENEWKKAVLCLIGRAKAYFGQEYVLIEFNDRHGVDSYVLSPQCSAGEACREAGEER